MTKKKPRAIRKPRLPNPIVRKILRMPGVTENILHQALYHLRKRKGICIVPGCSLEPYKDSSRCSIHRVMAARALAKFFKQD